MLNAGSQVVTALRQKRYVFNGITEGVDFTPQTLLSRQIAMPSSLQSFPRKGTGTSAVPEKSPTKYKVNITNC